MKIKKHILPFQNKYLTGITLAVLFLLSTLAAGAREARDTIIPTSITARPTWNGAVDSAWFLADVTATQTRKVSGATIIQRAMKYTDSTQMLAAYLAAINSHTAQLASHLSSINLNTAAVALINVQLPKKVDSIKVNGTTIYYYANGGIAYPAGTVSSSGGGAWGTIIGTLSAQTDLQNALNAKANAGTTLGAYGITDAYTKAQSDANYGTLSVQNTSTSNIAANTASINTINGYYTAGILKPANLPGATASTLGGVKVGSGLAIDVNSVLSATGGTVYTINNLQTAVFTYTGSNIFTLPQNASRVYHMWVYDTIPGTIVQVPIANFSFNGTNQVTFVQNGGAALPAGARIWIDYDIGSAFGVIDSIAGPMIHSENYYNTKYYPLAAGNTNATNITTLQGFFNSSILKATSFPALTGDVTTSAGALAATLATSGVTAGTYGDATHVPVITVDTKGRATTVTTALISGGGGGGSSFPTQQVDATTGTTVTVTNQTGNIWLIKNPATTVASYTITFPATPVDGQRMWVSFGGTIASGTVVSALSFAGNGSTILQNTSPASVNAGEAIEYQYTASNTTWYRIK